MAQSLKSFGEKVKRVLSFGKSVEQKLRELDLEGDMIANGSFMSDLTSFQEELIQLEDDAVKQGAEELYASTRALRDMNASLIATYDKMQRYTGIMIRQMQLEIAWLKVFERFEVVGERFYEFVKKFHNARVLKEEVMSRVKLATTRVSVAMALLFKQHVDMEQNFTPIDKHIKSLNPQITSRYHKEFVEKRKKLQEKIENKGREESS